MTIETLNRANAIKKTIDKLETEHSKISKFYSKNREDLTMEDLEDLFQIAMVNTSYTIKSFQKELEDL